jgi:Ni,Fe-hydrogenase maturation factor
LVVAEPRVADPADIPIDEWRVQFSNLHLAEPSRVLLMARAAGVLPARVVLVGCEPQVCEEYSQTLSAPVQAAVFSAAATIRDLVAAPTTAGVG